MRLATPGEPTLVLVVAAIVGVYAGLATGLFANAIAFFHLLFFRTSTFAVIFSLGERGDLWRSRFLEELLRARWHLEYLVVGGAAIAFALILDRIARLTPLTPGEKVPGGAHPFRTIAELLAVGLALFYPLTLLAAFNRSFPQTHVGLATILEQAPWFLVLLIPTIGGLAVGLLVHHLSPESKGHGVSEVIEAVAVHGGRIPASVAIWKSLTAAITIGSGGSVGREGPVVQVGSAVGSAIGQKLEFSRSSLLVLVGSGAAAGIAGSFNAPIAGAMFAVEIILLDFGVRTFTPIVLASVTAVITSQSLIGGVQEIVRPTYEMVSGLEIFAYAILGVLAGLVCLGYVRALLLGEEIFAGEAWGRVGAWLGKLPPPVKPAVGGFLLGIIGLILPRALGTGYETMNAALIGELSFGVLVAMLFAKTVATSLTLGSGGSGGSFFPSMVLGAMLGGAFGTVVHSLAPEHTAVPGAYALVGMGALIAGSTLAPLTGIVMLFELTGNYEIILPLMVTCVIASTMVHRMLGESIYTVKLSARGISVRSHREQVVLRSMHVEQAMTRELATIAESTALKEILTMLTTTTYSTFPVVNARNELYGLITVQDVRGILYEEGLSDLVVAKELARPATATLTPDDDLETALKKLVASDVDILPVVSRENPRELVGLLSRRDVLRAYGRAVAKSPGHTTLHGA
ncbi:chloride channel protein [Vulgatibacter sp.]|uniref:chloride channel protein n=1 Tax=Vulgatibacter sp. TaxID=1971226 RepID=UPI00356625B5